MGRSGSGARGVTARTIITVIAFGLIASSGVEAAHAEVSPGDNVVSVYFPSKKSSLDKEDKRALDAAVPLLANASSVRVDGFVQAAEKVKPTKKYLSRDRAEAVANYLQKALKKKKWNITVTYRGMGRPAVNFGSPFARRADVIVTGVQ